MLLPVFVANLDPRRLAELQGRLDDWAKLWRVPLLGKSIRIRASTRLRRALGTYRPSREQITLAAWLFDARHDALLDEVLCHEAAHAAVHLAWSEGNGAPVETAEATRSAATAEASSPWARMRAKLRGVRPTARRRSRRRRTPRPRPHGPEWRAFMETAGYEARVRFPEALMPQEVRAAIAASRCWEHRCPVCDTSRMARTRVSRWRCRRCVEAGRSGRLRIERKAGA